MSLKDVTGHDVAMVLSGVGTGLVASEVAISVTSGWFWPGVATSVGAVIGSTLYDLIMRPAR